MGAALIVDAAKATGTGEANLIEAVAGAGSTLTVRNSQLTSPIKLTDIWRKGVGVGLYQLTSPKIVPVSHGIQFFGAAGLQDFILPGPPYQTLTPQDILTMKLSDTSTDVCAGFIQSYYQELPGVEMTLKTLSDIEGMVEFTFAWEVAAEASATVGAMGEKVVTTTYDGSTANIWYAVLGYVTPTAVGAVGIKGVDTSQTFVGGPGDTASNHTSNYFVQLSQRSGLPCIPMWNAANKANTNVVLIDNLASTTANVSLILAQMKDGYTP